MEEVISNIKYQKSKILLLVILIFAAYLRLYNISEYMTFLGDEGRDVLVVKRMIVDHKFTLLGPTASVGGFFLGPIYYYFMLPFLWLWKLDPAGPAVMVALFGIATVYLVYLVGKNLFNSRAGLASAGLYALSPLVIAYSRSSWNPNLVPFFSLVLIYILWLVNKTGNWKLFVFAGMAIGIGLQLHYLFLFLIPPLAIWVFLYFRKKIAQSFIAVFVGFLIGYAPFLAFELRHGFPNTQSIIKFVFAGEETGFLSTTFIGNIADVSFRLFGRLLFRFPQPDMFYKFTAGELLFWKAVTVLTLTVGLILLIKKKPQEMLLTIWFVAPLALFGLYRKSIYDYYLGILFPLPFIVTGLILSKIRFKAVGIILFLLLLWFNWEGRPFKFPPNNQLGQTKTIAKAAFDAAGGKAFNFALITNSNSDHAYRYFFEIWGNPPVTIENMEKDPERRTVTDQLIVLCETPDCKPLGHPLWEVAGFGRAEIEKEQDVSFVKIYRLRHYNENTQ